METRQLLVALGLEIRPLDEALALPAGAVRAATRSSGLSFGDWACLALGLAEGVPVVTMDRDWPAISPKAGGEVVVA